MQIKIVGYVYKSVLPCQVMTREYFFLNFDSGGVKVDFKIQTALLSARLQSATG